MVPLALSNTIKKREFVYQMLHFVVELATTRLVEVFWPWIVNLAHLKANM